MTLHARRGSSWDRQEKSHLLVLEQGDRTSTKDRRQEWLEGDLLSSCLEAHGTRRCRPASGRCENTDSVMVYDDLNDGSAYAGALTIGAVIMTPVSVVSVFIIFVPEYQCRAAGRAKYWTVGRLLRVQ